MTMTMGWLHPAKRRGQQALLLCGALGLLCSCAEETIQYRLLFPSQKTFIASSNVTVLFYDASEGDAADEICRALSVGLTPTNFPEASRTAGPADVCEFLEGQTTETVPTGRLVIAVEVEDAQGTDILRGCKVADVYADNTETVEIVLATMPAYPEAPIFLCDTVEQRCDDDPTPCVE